MDGLKIFSKWFEHSSVRSAPHRILNSIDQNRYFSPVLSPVLAYPGVQKLPEKNIRSIEVQLLFYYLRFTEYLETNLVNPVILSIINNNLPASFSQSLKDEAYKIYCDEAYHAVQSHDMIMQITEAANESPLALQIVIGSRLEKLKSEIKDDLMPLFDLFFVCVAESLVSQELGLYCKDKTLHPSIMAIMQDHAKDEAAHALFFRQVMFTLKEQLSVDDFQYFLNNVPKFIDAYLLPERSNIQTICSSYLSEESIEDMLNEWLLPHRIKKIVDDASTNLYRTIQELNFQKA